MKKFIALIIILALAFGFCGGRFYENKRMEKYLYPNSGYIVYTDYENDLILIEDTSGMRWLYEGAEDWMEGDMCSLIMNNNGTENITDDEIVKIHYEGWGE